MKVRLEFASLMLLVSTVSTAEPITFTCVSDSYPHPVNLAIDLEKKLMYWGGLSIRDPIRYSIHHVNDQYISANRGLNETGGEIWVIDRVSGECWRSSIGIKWAREAIEDKQPGILSSDTFHGVCRKALL